MSKIEFSDSGDFVRVAMYSRVSTERQAKEGTIESQRDNILQYVKKNYPYVKNEEIIEYQDDGWSGTNLERPGIDDIFLSLDQDQWDVLIVDDPDRVAREPFLQLNFMEEVERHGKRVEFCSTAAPDQNDPESMLLFDMRAILSKYERVRINMRFRIGKLRKARQKHVMLSEAPYGYKLIKRVENETTGQVTQGYIEINPIEAKIIKDIFYWYSVEKITMRKITERLKEQGAKPRKNKNGDWNTSTIGNILRNSTYIGIAWYRRSEAVVPHKRLKKVEGRIQNRKTSRKIRSKDEWIEIPVPAILKSKEERKWFDIAQTQQAANRKLSERNKKNHYLLAGKIRCVCGAARTGEGPQNGKYLYYRCGSRQKTNSTTKRTCEAMAVNARVADKAVWDALKEVVGSREILEAQTSLYYRYKTNGANFSGRITSVENKVRKLSERTVQLKADVVDDRLSVSDYVELKKVIDSQQSELSKELHTLKVKQERMEANLVTEDELVLVQDYVAGQIKSLKFKEKRAIVEQLIDEVEAVPGYLTVTGFVGVSSSTEIQELQGANYSSNSNNNVYVKTIRGNRRTAKCRKIDAV